MIISGNMMELKPIDEMEAAKLRIEIAEVRLENARRLIEVRALHRAIERKSRALKSARAWIKEARVLNAEASQAVDSLVGNGFTPGFAAAVDRTEALST